MEQATRQSASQLHFRYGFGPFQYDSALELPALALMAQPIDPHAITIAIRLGQVPETLHAGIHCTESVWATPAASLLVIEDVGRFLIASGRDVTVDLLPGASLLDARSYLLGWVFGILCHQNGMLPLHASAVESHGQVTAFLGESGAGKSTLAACLHQRGFRVVSDDVCLLRPNGRAMELVPVTGWLKLWRTSWQHLGQQPNPEHQTFVEQDKYRLFLQESPSAAPLKIDRLVFPERAERATLEPLSATAAIARMLDATYLGHVMEAIGDMPRLFAQCAQVLQGAQAFRLGIPWGFEHMEDVLNLLQQDVVR